MGSLKEGLLMKKPVRPVLIAGLFAFCLSAYAQSGTPCDLTQDGKVDAADVQVAINGSLGLSTCNANILGTGVCNVVVVQRVVNASLGQSCVTGTGGGPVAHSVTLTWNASTSSGVTGYKVYRGSVSGGPYSLLSTPGLVTTYTDNSVQSGQVYYYVTTAVGSTESGYSNQAQATIPVP